MSVVVALLIVLEAPSFDGEPIEVDRVSDESHLNASFVRIGQ